jgi:hypothetical protein
MVERLFGLSRATPSLPARDLLRVPHKGRVLAVGSPAFGPSTYRNNVARMQEQYSHSAEIPVMTFRPATTSESISIVAYDFGNLAKPQIFDSKWLQAGRIVRTEEGVFTNTQETDKEALKGMLDRAKRVNGIYLLDNSVAFAPYETFETGVQEAGKFAKDGLARALEHTTEQVAENLRTISDSKHYKLGVDVCGFNPVEQPISRIVSLCSDRHVDGHRLFVDGSWVNYRGYAFGVLDESAEGASRKSK